MTTTSARTPAELAAYAAARLATLTTAQVVVQWNLTDALLTDGNRRDDALAIIQARQWIMEDLERRNPLALVAWLESNTDDPAPFYGVTA